MRIECVGSGSLGMLIAARLADAGADVTLVAGTGEQADRLKEEGLVLQDGEAATRRAVKAECGREEPAERDADERTFADWLLLTVKQRHITEAFVRRLAKRMGPETKLLCFQNGIGHAERLAAEISPERIYAAVTTEGARKDGLNRVSHTGRGVTRIGRAFPEAAGELAGGDRAYVLPSKDMAEEALDSFFDENEKKLRRLFLSAGFETFLSNNMDSFIWQKLLINAVINPLTALLGVTNGKLADMQETLALMDGLLAEGCEVAMAKGIRLRADEMKSEVLTVCRRTSANHSSMLQDLAAGRMTEIDWITGGLLREAAAYGIALPANRTLYALVKAKERTAVQES